MADRTFTVTKDGRHYRCPYHDGLRPVQEGVYWVKYQGIWTIRALRHLAKYGGGDWLPRAWCWDVLPECGSGVGSAAAIAYQAVWLDAVGDQIQMPPEAMAQLYPDGVLCGRLDELRR